jgi:hypothetical protein
MIARKPLIAHRVRSITGTFAFIEHRFLRDGFLADLSHHEAVLYFFLLLASDRKGISYYGYDKICTLLRMTSDEYMLARDLLIQKELIAFDGYFYQVLSLPATPLGAVSKPLVTREDMIEGDPATIQKIIRESFYGI